MRLPRHLVQLMSPIGTAQSARPTLVISGFEPVRTNCCPCCTSMWCSRCHTSDQHWRCRTSCCCTSRCSMPALKPCLRLLPTRSTLSTHRVSQRSSHLGTEPAPSSACSLSRSRRRSGIRPVLLLEKDTPAGLYSSCPRTQSCLPRQVQGRLESRLSTTQARLRWKLATPQRCESVSTISQPAASEGMGRLCEATIRRTTTRPALSCSLSPPHCNQQPSAAEL
jgi:hypothetical protein